MARRFHLSHFFAFFGQYVNHSAIFASSPCAHNTSTTCHWNILGPFKLTFILWQLSKLSFWVHFLRISIPRRSHKRPCNLTHYSKPFWPSQWLMFVNATDAINADSPSPLVLSPGSQLSGNFDHRDKTFCLYGVFEPLQFLPQRTLRECNEPLMCLHWEAALQRPR